VASHAADARHATQLEQTCRQIQDELGPAEVLIYNARGGLDLRAPWT
jgi:hypothetical protein